MRHCVFMLTLAALFVASEANAQQLMLASGVCNGVGYGVTNCTLNTGRALSLVGSALIPAGSRPGFVGTESWVDVVSVLSTVPDWWRGDACRAGAISAVAEPQMDADCSSLWDEGPAPLTMVSTLYPLWGGSNAIRFVINSMLPDSAAYDLVGNPGEAVVVFKLNVSRANTAGAGACTGCAQGACINFSRLYLLRQGETTENAESIVWHPGPGTADTFTWQTAPCHPDPVRNRTWGTLKSLYR